MKDNLNLRWPLIKLRENVFTHIWGDTLIGHICWEKHFVVNLIQWTHKTSDSMHLYQSVSRSSPSLISEVSLLWFLTSSLSFHNIPSQTHPFTELDTPLLIPLQSCLVKHAAMPWWFTSQASHTRLLDSSSRGQSMVPSQQPLTLQLF